MQDHEKKLEREIKRTLAEAMNKVTNDEYKKDLFEQLDSNGLTFNELMIDEGPSCENLKSVFEAKGIKVTGGSGSYRVLDLKPSRPFLQFGNLSEIQQAILLFEELAIKAGELEIFKAVRSIFYSEALVYKYDEALDQEGDVAYVHEGRAISLDTTWVLEIDNYDNIWRFTIRMPADHFQTLLKSL